MSLTDALILRSMAERREKCPRCDSKEYTLVRKGEFIVRECNNCQNHYLERTEEAAVKELTNKKNTQVATTFIFGLMMIIFGFIFIAWGSQMLSLDPVWFLSLAYSTMGSGFIFLIPGVLIILAGLYWSKKTGQQLEELKTLIETTK